MKNRNFFKNSIIALLPISLGLGVLLGVNKDRINQVQASSYSVNSVPKNIDLNDLSDSEIRSYYSGLTSKTASERQGTNLLKNLKPILKNGQKYFSYGSSATTAVWQAYEIVDRDWQKSPASEISGYNSSTNKITGYVYGSSNSSPGSNPYVHALYVNRNVTNQTRAWGNHNQDQWGINQEHIWAKSCGFNDNSPAVGARGDIMHLWAGNGKVNGTYHSNYYYGYVDKTKSYDDAKDYATTLSGNLKGYSKTKGGSYTVFEPQDSDKGDIARAIFYMAARYNNLSGSDSDGFDAGNPNLEIVNELNWEPGTSYTSSSTKKGQMGILQDLLEWNRLDPPDTWEIHRNNLLYKNFTNNRNPFIDFPEWAEFIWGKSTDGSYSSTSTGSANPSNDNINTFSGGGAATVSSVSISPSSLSLNLKGTTSAQLTATVSGTNNPSQAVTWASSNTNVVTVNNGVVTAVGTGNTTVRATSVLDNTKYGSCSVSVLNSTIPVTGVTLNKNSTNLHVGDSESLEVTVSPSNATNKQVSWTSSDDSVVTVNGGLIRGVNEGTARVTVISDDNDSYSAYCDVTVSEAPTSFNPTVTIEEYATANSWQNDTLYEQVAMDDNLTVSKTGGSNTGKYFTSGHQWRFYQSESAKITFSLPEGFEFDNLTLTFSNDKGGTLVDSNSNSITSGSQISVSGSSVTFSVSNSGDATNGQIRFTGFSATYHRSKTLESISVDASKAKTEFFINEQFTSANLVVTAFYNDESESEVSAFSVSSPNMSSVGTKIVTVTYVENNVEVSGTYEIEVISSSGSHSNRIVSKSSSTYFETGSLYFSGNSQSASVSSIGFTVVHTKETSSSNVNLTYNQVRIYANQKLTFTPAEGFVITSVVFTANSETYASRLGGNSVANSSLSRNGAVVTATPTDGTSAFSLKNSSVSYINYFVVYYEETGASEPSLTWDQPTINVYSGAATSANDVSSWDVTYDDGTGSTTKPSLGEITIKLGDDTISIPHTWSSDDDGKSLYVEFASISTSSCVVKVTQTIHNVSRPSSVVWDYTISSKIWSETGSQTIDEKVWTFSGTGNDNTPYYGYDNGTSNRGQQFGSSSHYFTSAMLSSTSFNGEIKSVTVYTSGASGIDATVEVLVGGTSYGQAASISSSNKSYSFNLGGKSGEIQIKWLNASSRALYIKQITVETISGYSNIANNVSHKDAQRAAVKYAKAFNTAMDSTLGCTANLSSAWSICSSAYSTFLTEAAALGQSEEAYAKDIIKYATVQYSDNSGEACIERMLKTYQVCVEKHGQSPFMSDLVSLSNTGLKPSTLLLNSNKTVVLIVVCSIVGVASIGGYFFIKSRKKEEF